MDMQASMPHIEIDIQELPKSGNTPALVAIDGAWTNHVAIVESLTLLAQFFPEERLRAVHKQQRLQ